jgi:hypothetical protein
MYYQSQRDDSNTYNQRVNLLNSTSIALMLSHPRCYDGLFPKFLSINYYKTCSGCFPLTL